MVSDFGFFGVRSGILRSAKQATDTAPIGRFM
jgi:hypothetical protein